MNAAAPLNAASRTRASALAVALAIAAVLAHAPFTAADATQTPVAEAGINVGMGQLPPAVVRSSPSVAWRLFLSLGAAERFDAAAHLLDLSDVPVSRQRVVGGMVAEKLYAVLHELGARPQAVTAEAGEPGNPGTEPVAPVIAFRFDRSGVAGVVRLKQAIDGRTGERAWLFEPQAVAAAPFWYRAIVSGDTSGTGEPLNAGLGSPPPEVQRGSPRAVLSGFLAASNRGGFALAAHYLDLGATPVSEQPRVGARLARRLHLALLRSVWIELDGVSDDPLGSPEVDASVEEERVALAGGQRRPFPIVLAHRWDQDSGHQWTFSRATVASVDRLYGAHGYGWLGDYMPLAFFVVSFAGLQLWQWLAVLAALVVGWAVSRVLGRWVVAVAGRLSRRTAVTWDDVIVTAITGPVRFVLWALILAALSPWFGLTPSAREVAKLLWKLLLLLGLGWFLLRTVDGVVEHLRRVGRGGHNQVGLGFLPVLTRFANAFVVVVIALAAFDVLGVKVVGILAGLGLGGVALAFAAQKTLENVFGAASVAADRPFQVGDSVLIGGDQGTVEDVGLRSTRLRTVGRTIVTIPNGMVAAGRIENLSARERFLFNPTLGLVYGTTTAQLRQLIDDVDRLLGAHPKVWQENRRVRFRNFGPSALEIEVQCWIDCAEFDEFLAIAEEINFAIIEIVERTGTSFAFPSRTVYLVQDTAPDPARAAAAAAEAPRRPGSTGKR